VNGTLGVITAADGSAEVTYNGWPLHTFGSDTAPGQTGGNGVGGKWFAAMPGTTASATGATTSSSSTPTAKPTNTPGGYGY
jgi:hypothetical protein